MKKRISDQMTFERAIFMLVVGILLGNVFTFGVQYWNKNIPREACTVVETQFLSYDEIWHSKPYRNLAEIAIDCADGNRYFIDGVSINEELRNQLSSLLKNDNITLLIHPNRNTIVEFSSYNYTLLTFDETIDKLEVEASEFLFLGILMYFFAALGLYYVIFHIIRRKKLKV